MMAFSLKKKKQQLLKIILFENILFLIMLYESMLDESMLDEFCQNILVGNQSDYYLLFVQ